MTTNGTESIIRGLEKYRTSKWSSKPEPVLIVKETEHFISYRDLAFGKGTEQRNRKDGYYSFHDSWEEAKEHLVQRALVNLENANRALDRARSELWAVKRMKKP